MRFLCIGLAVLSLALVFADGAQARGRCRRGWFRNRPHRVLLFRHRLLHRCR